MTPLRPPTLKLRRDYGGVMPPKHMLNREMCVVIEKICLIFINRKESEGA